MAKLKGQLFARLALDYADHPKIVALSDAAFRAHISMMLYARAYETDGRIPRRLAETRWGTESVSELLANDPEAPSLVELPEGDYLLYGYADMQETREQIKERRQVNAQNGRKGGRPRKTQSVSKSVSDSGTQMKAETETETDIYTGESPGTSGTADAAPRPDVESLCQRLADHIVSNGGKRPNITKRWRDEARLLLDRDGRDLAEAQRVIDWSQASTFWKANIMSMPKLRDKYDQLRLQADADSPQQAPAFDPRNWKV